MLHTHTAGTASEQFLGIAVKIQGHLKILEYSTPSDYSTGKNAAVLLNQRNAVHKDHASVLLALCLTNRLNSSITTMEFGTGGAVLTDSGDVVMLPPNVIGDAHLYRPTFFKLVDDRSGATPGNAMAIRHIADTYFTDAEIRCLINANEPFGQIARDS